jgi:hypothetical protein
VIPTRAALSRSPSDDIRLLLDEYKGHPSVRQLITDGYEIVTF